MTQQLDPQDDRETGRCVLAVENLGGIDACTVEFSAGVTLLTGRNATNRTSFLRALSGALGGDAASLKGDADAGRVDLTLDGQTYTRQYVRNGDTVQVRGDPFTDQTALVDLFVTVLEGNDARRAVERGADLREVLMRPVDTAAIEARIADLTSERESVRDELAESREARDELPELRARETELAAELEAVESELGSLRAAVDEAEPGPEATEAPVDELDDARREREELRERRAVLEAELEALRDEREELQVERAELPDTPAAEDDFDNVFESLRERKRQLDEQIASLSTIVEFNEDVLSGEGFQLDLAAEESPIDGLVPETDRELVCWTCGSHVDRSGITEQLEDLRSVIDERRRKRDDLADRLADLEDERTHVERVRERRAAIDDELESMAGKIREREAELEDLRDEANQLDDRIETLESEVAATDETAEGDLLETYEAISDHRYRRRRLERELTSVREEIDAVESTPDPAVLEDRLEKLEAELERQRTRVETLETGAVEAFNEHMSQVLDVLAYENLARVWIERTQVEADPTPAGSFELHVVRQTAEGTVYEDRIDHLSESEREVVGLVVTLAGYLVHDVAEDVPFMLLDSLEAIDATRIDQVVEHFASEVPYLLVALLPEDAQALSGQHQRIPADVLGD